MEKFIFCTMQLVYQVISKTLVIDKRIVTATLKKKSATCQKKKTLQWENSQNIKLIFSRTTKKASLKHQKLQKRKNPVETKS